MSKYGTENVGQGINQPIMAQAASCKLPIVSAAPPPVLVLFTRKQKIDPIMSPFRPDIYPPLACIDLLYDISKLNY